MSKILRNLGLGLALLTSGCATGRSGQVPVNEVSTGIKASEVKGKKDAYLRLEVSGSDTKVVYLIKKGDVYTTLQEIADEKEEIALKNAAGLETKITGALTVKPAEGEAQTPSLLSSAVRKPFKVQPAVYEIRTSNGTFSITGAKYFADVSGDGKQELTLVLTGKNGNYDLPLLSNTTGWETHDATKQEIFGAVDKDVQGTQTEIEQLEKARKEAEEKEALKRKQAPKEAPKKQ